jgi:hypothetical protein
MDIPFEAIDKEVDLDESQDSEQEPQAPISMQMN